MTRPVALVTGGTSACGRRVVRGLAAHGYDVAIHCHATLAVARELAAELEAAGGRALAVTSDLRDEAATRALVHRVADTFGRIDTVVCTAGIRRPTTLEELVVGDLRAHLDVACLGGFLIAQEAGGTMLAQDSGGVIVLLGGAPSSEPDRLAETVGWAAVPPLAAALDAEFSRRHPRLRVTCVVPRADDTAERVAADLLAAAAVRPAAGAG